VAALQGPSLDSNVLLAAGSLVWQGIAGEERFSGSANLAFTAPCGRRAQMPPRVKPSATFHSYRGAMQTPRPTTDRLGGALRALRQAYAGEVGAEDKITLGVKCLHVLIAQLAQDGVAQEDLQPLIDLETNIAALKSLAPAEGPPNRRRRKPPSDLLLARVSAVIDLLIKAGYDEERAAQLAARRMLAAGVPPPDKGGDARGWKRLLAWRETLSHGFGSAEAKDEYRDFTREIEAIPAAERLQRVLDERLWDRRRK
jgi:hypothetical protein